MKIFSDKKKLIQVLFISAITLLVIDFAAGKLFEPVKEKDHISISLPEADSLFKSSLKSLGIDEKLIRLKKKKGSQETKDYRVTVPDDLPIPLIVMEVKNKFEQSDVKINFNEKKIGGKTNLTIANNDDEIILSSEFDYDKTIFRSGGHIAFVLEGFDKLDEQNIRVLLSAPEQFGILLTPSKNNKKLADSLSRYRKEYLVLFNDDITELEFKLSESYTPKRLDGSLKSIIENFGRSVCITIDEQSDLYKSEVNEYLKKYFESRKISFVLKKSMIQPEGSSADDKIKSFEDKLDLLSLGGTKIFLIRADEFLSYLPSIVKYRKVGYKFVNPSEVLQSLID